ncbi:Bis(5'-nucleosyl)-tetraphosphatase [symmetrical] [Buchnera aphidicola (Periphyllus testudinaceus)]|uniref:symmetrical bis(5'-nucleosyl)-tetraphosphatase n=1 Tax=Buchnera aphidicola TaxID=9 RepID=UPI00346403A2
MSTYFIGDIHGCYNQFKSLLKKVNFNIVKDQLWITGDLVGRGPDSFKVLEYIFSLEKNVKLVLGNHDLNLISIYYEVQKRSIEKEISDLLNNNNMHDIMNKLRNVPLIQYDKKRKLIMTHAGIFPKWGLNDILKFSNQAHKILSGNNFLKYLKYMNGDFPNFWLNNLNKYDIFRFTINVFTRMRYCYFNGELDFSYKDTPPHFNKNIVPWFTIKNKLGKKYFIFFGHWSSLKDTTTPENIFPLDAGCCWGRYLTIFRWEDKKIFKKKCNLIK